jgi:nucleoside-diphosphate-sugar epimerase
MTLPAGFPDAAALEDFMTDPSPELVADLAAVEGDIMVLGVGGKMGPTLARLAKRASPNRRIIAVARFSDPQVLERLRGQGIECIACDLADRKALERLPNDSDGVRSIVYMVGHKFGASADPALTWMMNAGVPVLVADRFRGCRIVAFSTACVYPFVAVDGPGAAESLAPVPPAGDYTWSCVARERLFEHGSARHRTPGRMVRLSYAIDCRYGVLHDIAGAVRDRRPVDVTMGWADVIWQGDANEQALRLLAHCTTPTTPINVSGAAHTSIRWLAEAFGDRLGRKPIVSGAEAATAWLVDTSAARALFGAPRVTIDAMVDWVADWVGHARPGLGKPTHFETRDGNY